MIALLAFSGCSSTPPHSFSAQLSALQLGMTKDQVVELMGKPTEAGTGAHYDANTKDDSVVSEIFRYTETSQGKTKDWLAVFVFGKLTEYGPMVGDLRARYGGVFLDK